MQLSYDMVDLLRRFRDLADGPLQRGPQALAQHRTAGFADGGQSMECPFLGAALRSSRIRGVYAMNTRGMCGVWPWPLLS